MARRESKALAGFFPCPPELVGPLATMLRPAWSSDTNRELVVVDPCAGEGVALRALAEGLSWGPAAHVVTFGCEMERGRWEALNCSARSTFGVERFLHGDFFHVRYKPGMADVVWLNPPYDQDRDYKRLEARWLHACTPLLAENGVLVLVVPHYVLGVCAPLLAQHYGDVRCFRFPGRTFDLFKQVFVVARRTLRAAPDPAVAALCQSWASDATLAPELPDEDHAAPYPAQPRVRRSPIGWPEIDRGDWRMLGFDGAGVAAMAPWATERGPLRDLDHPLDLCQRIGQVYPVVNPPRPVHLASALAAGVFNGIDVRPNDGARGPRLLVKGTFARRWETVETKTNKDGEVTGELQVERPQLDVWVLDLDRGQYHPIKPSAELTGAASVAELSFADLLDRYSGSMLAALRAACPVLHDPARDPEPPVEELEIGRAHV